MRVARSMGVLTLFAAFALTLPDMVWAQERVVVAHSVSVSDGGSSLELELTDGKRITIEWANGVIRINGESAGEYLDGSEFEASWRSLVSHGGALNSAELVEALQGWEVEGLSARELNLQEIIEASLGNLEVVIAEAVSAAQVAVIAGAEELERELGQELERELAQIGTELELAQGLVIDLNRLAGSQGIFERLDNYRDEIADMYNVGFQVENGRVHVGDLTVRRGQVIEGNLAVLSGDVSVFGRVEGNLVALNGDIIVRSTGRIEGDALAINGTVIKAGGRITGRVRSERSFGASPARPILAPFANRGAVRQVSGVEAVGQSIATLLGFFVALACIGFGFTFFMPRQLQVVSETVSDSFGKSFLAGLFAQPLIPPAGVMVVAGLAITIVGIPLAILAVPALVLGVIAAAALGFLAAANSVGNSYLLRRMADGHAVVATPYRSMVYGLIGLMAIWAPAVILGWIPLVGQLFALLALAVTWTMATAGVGAAILSRAGLRANFAGSRHEPALTDEHYWPVDSSASVPARRGRSGR